MKQENYSHLERIQLLCVGGLLPLQTVCQLRADLSRRKSVSTIRDRCIIISYTCKLCFLNMCTCL